MCVASLKVTDTGVGDRLTGLLIGAFDDFPTISAAMQGVWGVWVNTDGFTIGEQKELFAGMRIFEIAKRAGSVRHYVWSNLDYASKVCVSFRNHDFEVNEAQSPRI